MSDSSNNISKWLQQHGFGNYSDVFVDNDIDLDTLPLLEERHLKELGLSMGHRLKLLAIVRAELCEPQTVEDSENSSHEVEFQEEKLQNTAERRQVTVMFCDLVDSTAMSTQMDPEDFHEVIRSYHDFCAQTIAGCGGYIAKFMGDGVLAYFGYPRASEHDVSNALKSSLELSSSIQTHIQSIGKVKAELAVRIGIATGVVVIGDLIGAGMSREHNVVGDTPNLAARLQSLAEKGEIIIADSSYQLAPTSFEFENMGLQILKGFSEPISAWKLNRFVEKQTFNLSDSPMVGRAAEMALLKRAWSSSQTGNGQVVLLSGEPGIGKSRLSQAIREDADQNGYNTVTLRCSPYHTNTPYYPVVQMLRRWVGLNEVKNEDNSQEKLEYAISRQLGFTNNAMQLMAGLLDVKLDSTTYPTLKLSQNQIKIQTLDMLVTWLNESVNRSPIVWIWEDLHWADPSTLDLLTQEIEECPTVPVFNLLTFRPEFQHNWTLKSHVTPIALNRLHVNEVQELIKHLAKGKSIPDVVVNHIIAKTDGIPLFAEELTKHIISADYLKDLGSHYELSRPLENLVIPSTLQDSLMARLDSYPRARELIQLASVIGREFSYTVVLELVTQDEQELQENLAVLVEEELLYQRGRPPKAQYIFKHALIVDLAYQSLLRTRRQNYHELAATYFEKTQAIDVNIGAELVAQHYSAAGKEYKAAEYWLKAGEHAVSSHASREAMTHLQSGLDELTKLPASEHRDQMELALSIQLLPIALAISGHGSAYVEKVANRTLTLARNANDTDTIFRTLFDLYRMHTSRVDLTEAVKAIKALGKLISNNEKSGWRIAYHYSMGVTNFFHGHFKQSLENNAEISKIINNCDATAELIECGLEQSIMTGIIISNAKVIFGYPDTAIQEAEETLRDAKLTKPIFTRVFVAVNASRALFLAGKLERSTEIARYAVEQAEEHGFAHLLASSQTLAAMGLQDPAERLQSLRNGSKRWFKTAGLFVGFFTWLEAETLRRLNRHEEILDAIENALNSSEKTGEQWTDAELYRQKAVTLYDIDANNIVEIENALSAGKRIAHNQQAKLFKLRIATTSVQLADSDDKKRKALRELKLVFDSYTEGFNQKDLIVARNILSC